jgi:cytochrome c556
MALLRLRKAKGETGSPACRSCGKTYRLAAASFQRLQAGLCASCWRKTPEGEEERRAGDRRRYQASEDRKAATAAAVARHRERQRAGGQP